MVKEIDCYGGDRMVGCGEKERETICPVFDRSVMTYFQGAKIATEKCLTD